MTASPRIVRLDIKTPQASGSPIDPLTLHLLHFFYGVHFPQKHHSPEILEPLGTKGSDRQSINHRIGVTFEDLTVELVAEIGQ